jgi:hypothetical protein
VKALEAFIGSFGILIFGFLSIPVAAAMVGAQVSASQGAQMSFIFFVLRFVWLYMLRRVFP